MRMLQRPTMIPGISNTSQIYSAQAPAFPGISLAGCLFPHSKISQFRLSLQNTCQICNQSPVIGSQEGRFLDLLKPSPAKNVPYYSARPQFNLGHLAFKFGLKPSFQFVLGGISTPQEGTSYGKQADNSPVMAFSQQNEPKRGGNTGFPATSPHDPIQGKSPAPSKRTEPYQGPMGRQSPANQKAQVPPASMSLRQPQLLAEQEAIKSLSNVTGRGPMTDTETYYINAKGVTVIVHSRDSVIDWINWIVANGGAPTVTKQMEKAA